MNDDDVTRRIVRSGAMATAALILGWAQPYASYPAILIAAAVLALGITTSGEIIAKYVVGYLFILALLPTQFVAFVSNWLNRVLSM